MTIDIVAGRGGDFSKAEQEAFIDLVRSGGEVRENTLRTNVPKAEVLVFLRDNSALCGVAALKNPLTGYRMTVEIGSGVSVREAHYPYELGYVFVRPEARRQGYCRQLVDAAMKAHTTLALFATARVDNAGMHRVLEQSGFSKAGKPYGGRAAGTEIQLFLRGVL